MGILEKTQQRKKFDREFEAYLGGFYDDYSYLDEYSNGSHCDLINEALLLGIDITKGKLNPSDINKIKRYNRDK
jgi:hypothetical protein